MWIRTLRVVATTVAIFTALAVLIVTVPINEMLRSRDRQQFAARTSLVAAELEQFVSQSVQVASQIPSRTQIRRALVDYLDEKTEREAFVEFTEPRLRDAVDGSDAVVAVFRRDRNGTLVASAYPERTATPPPVFSVGGATIAVAGSCDDDPAVFFVTVPILEAGVGLVGFDSVAIDMRPLCRALAEAAALNPGVHYRVTRSSAVSRGPVAVAGPAAGVQSDRSQRVAVSLPYGFDFNAELPRTTLHRETNREVTFLALVVGILGGLTTVLLSALLVDLRRRSEVDAARLEELVVEQTTELQKLLAGREILLREVHHRIKNDLATVEAMLSLHSGSLGSGPARRAVEEARQQVALVADVYDQLSDAEGFETVRVKPVFERIVESVRRARAADSPTAAVTTDIEDVTLTRQTAIPLGIIANELVVNSFKHAAADPLRIDVSLRTDRRALVLSVRDGGSGGATPPRPSQPGGARSRDQSSPRSGYGLEMIEALTSQLEGRLERDELRGETRVIVAMDLYPASAN